MSLIYQNDEGVRIVAKTAQTTFPATTTFFLMVTKPSGATADWAVTVDFSTGDMTHTTLEGELDETGIYKIQVAAHFDTGDDQVSDINSFEVHEKLY